MREIPSDPLDYYAQHGPITNPQEYAELLKELPQAIPELCRVVQGVMIHHAFGQMRSIYNNDTRLRVPPVIKSYTRTGPRLIDLTITQ